jgi:hypothetical protein
VDVLPKKSHGGRKKKVAYLLLVARIEKLLEFFLSNWVWFGFKN